MEPRVLDFEQARAVELGLDGHDLIFLAWFTRFAQTKKMRSIIVSERPMYWLAYSHIISQLPILRITNKDAMSRRLARLVAVNVLRRKTVRKAGGSETYYGFGDQWESLLETHPTQKSDDTRPESRVAPDSKVVQILSPKEIARDTEIDTVAIAPVAKPSPYRLFSDLFEERAGHKWACGTKEGACLARLVKWAKAEQPARWEEYLRAFMDGAWALKQGALVGMRDFDKRRWATLPYTPSALLNQCAPIVAALETTQVKPMDANAYADSLLAKVGK